MNHDEAHDRLGAYEEGTLDPRTESAVAEHVAGCAECTADLAALRPVDLSGLDDGGEAGGPSGMQRAVRRALLRTAVDAAALAVIAVVVIGMLSLLVVQPLLLGRSGRAAVAARAAYEAPMLFNPGVSVTRFSIASGLMDRTAVAEAELPLGSGAQPVRSSSTRVGLFDIDIDRSGFEGAPTPIGDVLPGLDQGTVVTVVFDLETPMAEEEAQSLVADPGREVRIPWVGFDVMSSTFPLVGYPVCRSEPAPSMELFGASSASAGGTVRSAPPSVSRAIDAAAAALTVMASNDEVADTLAGGGGGELEALASALSANRPRIRTLVVTGPTAEVSSFLDDLGVVDGAVLAVGFYSWGSPVCGR